MNLISTLLVATVMATGTIGQVGGGSAAYGQRQSGYDRARTAELAKRSIWKNDDGRYVEAAVLINVRADEYVAVFGVSAEGPTIEAARQKMDDQLKAFSEGVKALKSPLGESFVDFVAQTRIYGFIGTGTDVIKEIVEGFEVKKNVAIRFKDAALLEKLSATAAKVGIFDLIKVDYIINDHAKVQSELMDEAGKIVRRKLADMERLLGFKVSPFSTVYPPQFSVYYPAEMYDSYVAQEAESIYGYRQNQVVQRMRKPQTFYYRGLDGKDFDHVINPAPTEPMVQFTVYVRVKYGT